MRTAGYAFSRCVVWLCLACAGHSVAAAQGDGPQGGFEALFARFNGTRIVKSLREFTAGQSSLRAWQHFRFRRWRFGAELGRSQSLTQFRWVDGGEALGFEPAVAVTALKLEITPPSRVATVAVGVYAPDTGLKTPGVSVDVWLQPVRVLGLGLEATRPPEWPTQWTAAFAGEGGTIHWNMRTAGTRWQTAFTPSGSIRISGHLSQVRFQPESPGDEGRSQYSLRPTGLLLTRSVEVTDRIRPGLLQLGLTLSGGDFTGQLRAYTEGASFGQLGVIEATWQYWQFAVSRPASAWQWSSAVSGGSAEFVSMGVVKFWPFSEGLASLLGLRRHLQVSGSATWWRLGGHVTRSLGRSLQFGAGLDAYRVKPLLTMLSWQPLFLGMGIADPKTDRLNVKRVDLGAVELSARVRIFSGIAAHAVLRQWLPLGMEETRTSAVSAPAIASGSAGREVKPGWAGTGLVVSAGLSLVW